MGDSCKRKHVTNFTLYIRQTVTTLGSLIGVVTAGMTTGYSAVLLPQLKPLIQSNETNSTDSWGGFNEIKITTIEEESWIAAAAVLPMAPGCFLAGVMMDRFGRRTTALSTCPLFLLGWLTLGFAEEIYTMIVGRFICGLCVGIIGPLGPVYISETSDPKLRGLFLAGTCVSLTIGIMCSHLLGTWLHWRITAYVCALFPILGWFTTYLAQESPTWLHAKGKIMEARESWIYLRGEKCYDELMETTRILENYNQNSKGTIRSEVFSRKFFKPLAIVCLYFLTLQFAGLNVVTFYSVQLLADISGPEHAYIGSLIIDATRVIFSSLACVLVKRCARRTLTFFSGGGTAFTLLSLSLCLVLDIGKPWVPAILLFAYAAFVTMGLIPIPWMLSAELFSRKCRGLGSGLTSGFAFLCFFVVVKTGPSLFETVQPYGAFAIYGLVALIGTILLYLTLPETKDRSLEDIERSFDKKRRSTYNSCDSPDVRISN